MPKLRFLKDHGSPDIGSTIRAGAVIEMNDFWSDRLTADGVATLAEPELEPKKDEPPADKTERRPPPKTDRPTTPAPRRKK